MQKTNRPHAPKPPTPQRGREDKNEAYWREHAGVTKCPKCGNVHFKKRWYASEADLAHRLKKKKLEITERKFCQACTMVKEHMFEGEVFVEGFSSKQKNELLNLIKNFGERATERDPQDRIIKIEKTEKGYRITTTENQLAGKLAKKIKDVFKKVDVRISHAPEPAEVSRVRVAFRQAD
ncbi:MAG: hypothetical protein HYT94_03880 [Parcubacteria group bacterium]|nr:hypothetical protein [Parcubacteria group bacterium]